MLALVEFKALSELRNGHLFHEAVATSLSRIESFGALDGNLLKLSDLADELHLLGKFGSLLILAFLKGLLEIFVHLVSYLLVLCLLEGDLLGSCLFVRVNLGDDLFLLLDDLLKVDLPFLHHFVHLIAHLVDKMMVLFLFALASEDGLFTGKLHFDFLFLDVLEALDLVFLVHLSLPAIELRSVLQAHCHLLELDLSLILFLINQVLFSLESRHIELDIGVVFIKVGHGSGSVTFEFERLNDLFLDLLLDFVGLGNRGPLLSGQRETLFVVALIVALDGVDGGLAPLALVVLNVRQRLFVHILRNRPGLNLSLDLLRRWDHLGLGLRQVERLELRAFRLLLFFGAINGHQLRRACIVRRKMRLCQTTHRR